LKLTLGRVSILIKLTLLGQRKIPLSALILFSSMCGNNALAVDNTNLVSPLNSSLKLGLLSFDSNVYRSPDHTYNDYFSKKTGPVSVIPIVRRGFYFPISSSLSYERQMAENLVGIKASAAGDFYQNETLRNANQYSIDVDLFGERQLNEAGEINVGFYAGNHSENYTDRDSGMGKTSGQFSISDKYKYKKYGAKTQYKAKFGKFKGAASLLIEKRDYVDTTVVAEYDQVISEFDSDIKYRLKKRTTLGLGYQFSNNDYSDRHARRLDGFLSSLSPLLKYKYHTVNTSFRQRISKKWIGSLGYSKVFRKDVHVGYNDYSEDQVDLKVILKKGDFRIRSLLTYRNRYYPNAFAFDNPVAGKNTYTYMKMANTLKYEYSSHMNLFFKVLLWKVQTQDTRYEYDRYKVSIGGQYNIQ